MARTWHHGNKAKQRQFGHSHYRGFPADDTPPKRKKQHCHWHWLRNEPSWWVHEFMEVKHRARTKAAERVAMMEGDAVFPHYKRPHLYYW